MDRVVPKPLPEVNLPKLNQVGQPASSRCEDVRESIRSVGILVSDKLLRVGESLWIV